ncbi:MAG: hypothetical protein ACK5UC_06575 [Planctomycetaceae bacterium]|jgi:hypothetical protein
MKSAKSSFVFFIPFILGCGASAPPVESPNQPSVVTTPVTPQAEPTASTDLLAGGETFDGKVFKLRLPKDWFVQPDPVVPLHVRASQTELFPNMKVATLKLPDGKSITDVVKASQESYLKSGTVEEVTELALQGRQVHRMVMTQNLPGNPNRQLKYFVPAGPRVVIFSGQSTSEEFENHLPLFESVVRSLELAP